MDVSIVSSYDPFSNHNSSSSSLIAGSGRGVCAASAADTTSPIEVNPANRFDIESLSMRLARCFLRGLPIVELSSGNPAPNTLLARVGCLTSNSVAAGGEFPEGESVPVEAGDLRDAAFRGSAEWARLSYEMCQL